MSQKKPMEYKIWYRTQYLSNVCHICKEIPGRSSISCPSCRLVIYCGPTHMEQDLDDHEELCEALKDTAEALGSQHPLDKAYLLESEQLRNFRLGLAGMCSKYLGRPLFPWEIEVCLFPPICATCHKFDSTLSACSKCLHTRWCSAEHTPKKHHLHCPQLILFREILQRKVHVIYPLQLENVPQNMEELRKDYKDDVVFSLLTEVATSPLSILNVIPKGDSQIVHVIGPEPHFEANNLAKWETFLFDLLPQTQNLHLAFIGPEIGPLPKRTVTKGNRKLKYIFHQMLYHEYVTNGNYEKPTLICAFNPGLYRSAGYNGQDTWSETIKSMFKSTGVSVLITAYTEKEIKLDFKRVTQSVGNIKTVVEPSLNPFSSLRPLMNFVSDESTPIVFKNAFYTILQA